MTAVIFIIVLVILVLVHEFGHFMAAKMFGVKVEEFGIGFPPRLLKFKKGETVYSLNALPLGGFVRIFGEEGEGVRDPRSYAARPAWQRSIILVAGVFLNIVFAFLIFWFVFIIGFPTALGDTAPTGTISDRTVRIVEIAQNSPADEAELKRGDIVVEVTNFRTQSGQDVQSIEALQEFTNKNKGEELTLTVKRGEELLEKTVLARLAPPEEEGPLGIVLADVALVSYPWNEAFVKALEATGRNIWLIILSLWLFLKSFFATGQVIGEVAGPVGIASMTMDFYILGFRYLLTFVALISVNLGVFNIFPIPALDGGRLFFVLIEKLKGSPMNPKLENSINALGFAFLLTLVLIVTAKDILQL